ncbi:hypothetical protein KM043_002712 [Ampulex compressa]|nr:hypothetical protein KM043_002712 [Ampulex compressa]
MRRLKNVERTDARPPKLKGMLSIWAWTAFNLLIHAAAISNGISKAFIEITELEYEEACHDTAKAEWAFLNFPSNETLSAWESKQILYAEFKRGQKNEIANVSRDTLHNQSLVYKYDVIEKAGDALMEEKNYENFVNFVGRTKFLRSFPIVTEKSNNSTSKDVDYILSHEDSVEKKRAAWVAWHQEMMPLVKNFTDILPLAEKAARLNGAENIKEYWESLSGCTDGYTNIAYQWSNIVSLHNKIVQFALTSLSYKYGSTINETIPAYMLGSLQEYDWTTMSVDIVPYQSIMYNIRKNLWKKKLVGKYLYKTASSMGSRLLHQVPQAEFWEMSQFNQECPSKLINLCEDGNMRVSTCFEATLSNFFSAHRNVAKILFNQMSVETTPILNIANRYSGAEEGIAEFFGILSASPAWLNYTHLMNNSIDNEKRTTISLMITALDILPRLAYYMAADMWRINALETGITEEAELISSWWRYRQEYEKIFSNDSDMPTFLSDDYIINNKPYLPKVIGILLGFQLYEFVMESTEVRYDEIIGKQINPNFIKMIQQGSADDWMGMLNKYLEIDDITADPLLSFFSPLEEFLEEIQEDFQYKSGSQEDATLDILEKRIIEEINAPTTTTTPATTTVTMKKKEVLSTVGPTKASQAGLHINTVAPVKKELASESHVQADKPDSEDKSSMEKTTKVPFDESLMDNPEIEEETKPKINTSKAVWAVGAVLVATITVCVIAIFGRRRCRKTPKNRRYV